MTTIDVLVTHGLTPLVFLVVPVAVVMGLLRLAGRAERRREEGRARQVMLTDAIHSKLGAVVAPVVSRRRGGWDVSIAVPFARPALVAEVVSIVHGDFTSRHGGAPRIVLTAQAPELGRFEHSFPGRPIRSSHTWRPAVQMAGARAEGAIHVRE